jgi:hypothetical protein
MARVSFFCDRRCRTELVVRGGRTLDAVTGWPHVLTCPIGLRTDGRRVSVTVLYCGTCGVQTCHQRVSNADLELVVCLQCGAGRWGAAGRFADRCVVELEPRRR